MENKGFIIKCLECGELVKLNGKHYYNSELINILGAFDGSSDILITCNNCGNEIEI